MNRNVAYVYILIVLLTVWAIFGAGPHSRPAVQSPMPRYATTLLVSKPSGEVGIPVTGDPQAGLGALLNAGLAGLAVLAMILMVLSAADQPTAARVGHEETRHIYHD